MGNQSYSPIGHFMGAKGTAWDSGGFQNANWFAMFKQAEKIGAVSGTGGSGVGGNGGVSAVGNNAAANTGSGGGGSGGSISGGAGSAGVVIIRYPNP